MIEFTKITPQSRNIFDLYYSYKTIQNCETAFANLCSYSFLFHGEYAIVNDLLITRVHYDYNKEICYHCPIGLGDKVELVNMLIKDSIENNYKLKLILDCKEVIQVHFSDVFEIEDKREFYDYLYLRESLETLSGKKLQAKRNHCNKFEKLYDYKYLDITSENIYSCIDFAKQWLTKTLEINSEEKESYENEFKVIEYFAENFEQLELIAGAIMVDDDIVAFTLGSKINNNTFCTHIEKANKDYDGAYAIINREFAKRLPKQYIYINREEDLGLEGLRKAKLSYNPIKLIEKQIATYIGQ